MQENQLICIYSTSYQKKFENRTKSYFSYIEDDIQSYKYVFSKAMKIQFLSSIFIIILDSSCDVGCHWIFVIEYMGGQYLVTCFSMKWKVDKPINYRK